MSSMSISFRKSPANPVVGKQLGVCFDVSVLHDVDRYRMWFSWRDRKAIALVESIDGVSWSESPTIAIARPSGVRKRLFRLNYKNVSRPCVVAHGGKYHVWYCVHSESISIAYAVSKDGVSWRQRTKPVLVPALPWEKDAVMCPCVIYDNQEQLFKMWYSGGEQYEPDAIGYATSPDGISWTKHPSNPVFAADPSCEWEKDRVTAMHVMKDHDGYLGFYIGFADGFESSCIGAAKSKDGIDWVRHDGNPILSPGLDGTWDDCNVYKPYVIRHNGTWLLWYNASRKSDRVEQIGLATCEDWKFEATRS
jgi:predicted GH43/DUF377 family glycosyl hydrolase